MTRNLKALGLALVAVFAMSAIAASAAQAAGESFHAHSFTAHNVITTAGEGNQILRITNGPGNVVAELACTELRAEGDQTGEKHQKEAGSPVTYTSKELTMGFRYSGCTATPGGQMTVISSACHYKLTSETDANGHAPVHIECGTGAIEIKTEIGCTLKIPTQTPGGGVHYTNLGETSNGTITGEATLTGIKYTANFICQLGGIPASGEEADYEGKFIAEGKEYVSGTTGSYVEGNKVGIFHGPTK